MRLFTISVIFTREHLLSMLASTRRTARAWSRKVPAISLCSVAPKYGETRRATESEDRETRSQDESIKNLPKGRMEILMSNDTRGTLHSLVQVRPPDEVVVPGLQPVIYPRLLHSRAESSGANLRF